MDKLTKLREKVVNYSNNPDEHIWLAVIVKWIDQLQQEEEPSEEIVPDYQYHSAHLFEDIGPQVELLTKGLQQLQRKMALLHKK